MCRKSKGKGSEMMDLNEFQCSEQVVVYNKPQKDAEKQAEAQEREAKRKQREEAEQAEKIQREVEDEILGERIVYCNACGGKFTITREQFEKTHENRRCLRTGTFSDTYQCCKNFQCPHCESIIGFVTRTEKEKHHSFWSVLNTEILDAEIGAFFLIFLLLAAVGMLLFIEQNAPTVTPTVENTQTFEATVQKLESADYYVNSSGNQCGEYEAAGIWTAYYVTFHQDGIAYRYEIAEDAWNKLTVGESVAVTMIPAGQHWVNDGSLLGTYKQGYTYYIGSAQLTEKFTYDARKTVDVHGNADLSEENNDEKDSDAGT